ncbi:hypothetical protein ACRALDRAFT_2019781 [Sodiomyces alcalophilus JCM 7366]|uniref:uncharacterized protein n=1 Tax=Sodiomyces alcalophilus JCM 7366 TaxID=591952 RepID=UPI0039B50CC8
MLTAGDTRPLRDLTRDIFMGFCGAMTKPLSRYLYLTFPFTTYIHGHFLDHSGGARHT